MQRVTIGSRYLQQPRWKTFIGVPLIYLPIIATIPPVALTILIVRAHLRLVGAKDVRSYASFVPSWTSHRYTLNNQVIYTTGSHWYNLRHRRFYWIFNCKLYCPLSVALFRYLAYLVKVVENWWCPFDHDQKQAYAEAAIDYSYWHLHDPEMQRLHPDDRNNPQWNASVPDSGQQKNTE